MNRIFTKKILLRIAAIFVSLVLLLAATVLGLNAYVKGTAEDRILSSEEAADLDGVDCILVLGCLVKSDGSPSDMLADRLTRGVELYELGVSPKLLMSGDHGREDYDEVSAMKQFAIEAGIPSEDIFLDHAGFSTYESMVRAKEVFGAGRVVIVTQEYHLYRALYVAERLGMEAYGVCSDYRTYSGQVLRDAREVLARAKDWLYCAFEVEPTYLGDPISLEGSGDVTND